MRKTFVFLFVFLSFNSIAQNDNKLLIDIMLSDYPYSIKSAKTFEKKISKKNPNFSDFIVGYNSPSMQQSISTSASFYNSINFAFSKLKINWFKNNYLNELVKSSLFVGSQLIVTYLPLGDAWLHEEFHRAVLTNNLTRSYNQVYDFPFFRSSISVNRVSDDDLIRFKRTNPQDFTRLHSAGIEGEYMLNHKLQSYNFFYNQQYPYYIYSIMWTANSFYYVWFCHTGKAEAETAKANSQDGKDITIRDFTGLDFLAWTYDLFNPHEPYEARGIHPSGVGINRYIAPSRLNDEQLKYLKRQGFLQLINFASPMMLGINRIPSIKKNGSYFNFAFHHILTSFGNDISFYFFYKKQKFNIISAIHLYNNYKLRTPGLEFEIIDYDFLLNNFTINPSVKTYVWLQPKNLLFFDTDSKIGGLIDFKLKFGKKHFYPYLSLTLKSKGWVAGYVEQNKYFSVRAGVSWYVF